MHIVLITLHVIDRIVAYGWPVILFGDLFFRTKTPFRQRLQRGRHFKWTLKHFGGPGIIVMGGWIFAIACVFTPAGRLGFDTVYVYLAVALIVDWITGSDDPPYRRWLASASDAIKKLKISPPPRPIIDRA